MKIKCKEGYELEPGKVYYVGCGESIGLDDSFLVKFSGEVKKGVPRGEVKSIRKFIPDGGFGVGPYRKIREATPLEKDIFDNAEDAYSFCTMISLFYSINAYAIGEILVGLALPSSSSRATLFGWVEDRMDQIPPDTTVKVLDGLSNKLIKTISFERLSQLAQSG